MVIWHFEFGNTGAVSGVSQLRETSTVLQSLVEQSIVYNINNTEHVGHDGNEGGGDSSDDSIDSGDEPVDEEYDEYESEDSDGNGDGNDKQLWWQRRHVK